MMFWQVARDLTRRLPEWDASAKLSLAIAFLLLLAAAWRRLPGSGGDSISGKNWRFRAARHDSALIPLGQSARCFALSSSAAAFHCRQDYQAARALLEVLPDRGRASVDALVLLGNTYRHLSQFDRAQAALARALELKPTHDLALFSAGKLNLVQGRVCRRPSVF